MSRPAARKPKLAVWKFASCDGCQLSILDCEDDLLELAEVVRIAYFPEATRATQAPPYDVSLVEGSITNRHDAKAIQEVRRRSKMLVAIGACATTGGLQALKNDVGAERFALAVYPRPEFVDTLETSTPISAHVKVDCELPGCPVSKRQLIQALAALLIGRKPELPTYPLCVECKRQGLVCLTVARSMACLGPVTRAGCGAICPTFGRGCHGCFGPSESPNCKALGEALAERGCDIGDLGRSYLTFNAAAPTFHEAGHAHKNQDD